MPTYNVCIIHWTLRTNKNLVALTCVHEYTIMLTFNWRMASFNDSLLLLYGSTNLSPLVCLGWSSYYKTAAPVSHRNSRLFCVMPSSGLSKSQKGTDKRPESQTVHCSISHHPLLSSINSCHSIARMLACWPWMLVYTCFLKLCTCTA